jgi:hypothetical protein
MRTSEWIELPFRVVTVFALILSLSLAAPSASQEVPTCHDQCDNGAQMMHDAGFPDEEVQEFWHNCLDECNETPE